MSQPPTTPRLRDWAAPGIIAIAVCVAAVLVGAAFLRETSAERNAGAATTGPAYTIDGHVRLEPGDFTTGGQGCTSTRADIHPGAQVMVVDGTGATLTYASLGATVLADGRCSLPFTLAIPAGRGEYGIDVASYGQLRYLEAELQDLVELTIG